MRKIRLERPVDCEFDERKADRAVRFFNEHLHHTKAPYAGRPFQLRPWQEVDIREIFGRVDEKGNRLINQVYIQIPKKNGKSEVAAGVALKLLFADDEFGAEIYSAASDREQASIVYDVASSMVRRNPKLRARCKNGKAIVDSRKRIAVPKTESFYQAISREVATKHGYNTHGVIFDEAHAQKDMRLWEVLTFGSGDTRLQQLVYCISTAGVVGESPVAEMLYEDADQILRGVIPCPSDFYPVIYAAPDDAAWDDEEVWHYCNPALGDFLRLDKVREACERAKRRLSEQNLFRRLRLNQWTAQQFRWLDLGLWDKGKELFDWRDLRERPCSVGIDLSSKLDLTSLVCVWVDDNGTIYFLPFFWIPRGSLDERRSSIEIAKFEQWEKDGFLEVTEGNAVNYEAVREKLNDLRDEWKLSIQQVAADPMFAGQLMQQMEADGFEVVEFRQNFVNFTPPCQELEAAVADGRVRHNAHPILRFNADCVTVRKLDNGGMRPVKPDRLRSKKRIDGIVAGLMGLSRAVLQKKKFTSIYANPDTAVM